MQTNKNINNLISKEKVILPDFFQLNNIVDVFNSFENYLINKLLIIELELFFLDGMSSSKLLDIGSSVSLIDVYKELEERGLLDWAAKDNEIKIIPNITEIEQIKSLIIIPIVIFNKIYAFFIANTTLKVEEIENVDLKEILNISQEVFSIFNIIQTEQQNQKAKYEQKLLNEQVLISSSQIAASEIISIITENFELYLKNIKTNYDLIQKGVGDKDKRQTIIYEHFNQLQTMQQIIKNLSSVWEYEAIEINLLDIINLTINIATPILTKNGIKISTNFEIDSLLTIKMFRTQFLFAFLTILINIGETIEDSGTISIGIYENPENKRISIIISANNSVNEAIINGNLILSQTFSKTKRNNIFRMHLAQQIITNHNGRLTVYPDKHKGITYKLIL